MSKVTMIGCDLHDRSMLLKVAVDKGRPIKKSFLTLRVEQLISWIRDFAARQDADRIVFAYEASGQGFGLFDALTEAGIECQVLAPSHLPYSAHRRKNKTDEKDAEMILDELRAHVLAGRKLPTVWIPDRATRDDREPVRLRLQLGEQRTRVKNQIRALAKRVGLRFPATFTKSGNWSKHSIQWLQDVAAGETEELAPGIRHTLKALVALHENICGQMNALDKAIRELSRSERYAKAFRKLRLIKGVGTLSAMVFLTELGDLNRFQNRRQLGAYLGLVPSAAESGEKNDRKGKITRQGPADVRHVLCQAAWAAIRHSPEQKEAYERIRRGSSKRTKVAIVAMMRRLGITMWQMARSDEADKLLEKIDRQKEGARSGAA